MGSYGKQSRFLSVQSGNVPFLPSRNVPLEFALSKLSTRKNHSGGHFEMDMMMSQKEAKREQACQD